MFLTTMRLAMVCVLLALWVPWPAQAEDADFLERFALAEDREAVLAELIPGTEDYYFYHCLHYQNTQRFNEVESLLRLWIERYNRTPRVREIQNRQALLRHETDPRTSLKYLRRELGLQLNHQRETIGARTNLQTTLDPNLFSRNTLTRRAMSWHRGTVQGFEETAFDWLIEQKLDPKQRRDLLQRLARPDYSGIVQHIAEDLNAPRSGGFGSLPIHQNLLRAQLNELLQLRPKLLNEQNFVYTYLMRLQPGANEDWRHDAAARERYLNRMEHFVTRLNESHNSLKAHVLYQRLVHERALGNYDKERFMRYLELPRSVPYINRDYLQKRSNRDIANLQQNFGAQTEMPIVGNDEPLVRDYLQHFFVTENSYDPYATYLDDTYLKELFAETKIVNGLGDMEEWFSLLSPVKYQSLRERIDLDFDSSNQIFFNVNEPVAIHVWVKNIETLIVKVFEVNTENFYRRYLREVNTDIDLDGLVAREEHIYTYEAPPLRRIKRSFTFPELDHRGVYIVEFIGNGKSSRALIRKGRLNYLVRTSIAGHVFTVLDESKKILPGASLWLDGHTYRTDEEGRITAPFTNTPGRQPIVLSDGHFAYLEHFNHESETYTLSAGIHVDRESLRKRREAQVIVRPALYLNGTPVTLSVLENVNLAITSTDRLGVSTSTVVEDFKLARDRDTVHTFRVPEDLLQMTFTLRAKVQNVSQNKKIDLATAKTFSLNHVDTTDKIETMHLNRMAGEYVLDVLDKTGLPMRGRPIHLTLKHRDFRDQITTTLQSDVKGRIQLGPLNDIVWIKTNSEDGSERSWNPGRDAHNYPTYLHGIAGEALHIPYLGTSTEPIRDELSLIERRGNHYFADRFASLRIEDGFIVIDRLAPGDYELTLKPWHSQVRIRLSAGAQTAGYVYSNRRHLELSDPSPLHIARVRATDDEIRIELANHSQYTRVHVYATRFIPAYSAYADLGALSFPEPYQRIVPRAESAYISGRNIGDEYRYILDRKYARKFPGNALDRPGMLINPWAVRDTQTEQQAARPGEAPRASRAPEEATGLRAQSPGSLIPASIDFANLDFLSGDSVALLNLVSNEDGVLIIDRADLSGRQHLHIIALDPGNTAYRELSLEDTEIQPLDLRLARGLNPVTHSTQQKRITVLEAGDTLVLEDMATSRIEAYDSVESVFRLFATLSKNPTLTEFDFITQWPELPEKKKKELFSKYACHELNYFLYKKDPEFFAETVLPYLRNKMHKTFMDHWLIGADLGHYLSPWEHAQLNIVEKILLAERIPTERVAMARDVADRYNLLPIDIDLFNHLFQTAIQGSALQFRGGVGGALDMKNERLGFEMDDQGAFREGGSRFLMSAGAGSNAPALESAEIKRSRGLAMKRMAPADKISALSEAETLSDISGELAQGRKDFDGFDARDELRRNRVAQFYLKLDKTKEWAENNYYHLPIEMQYADLITVNAFWRDFATRNPTLPFRSTQIAMASRNFPEMMFALAALDLPFAPEEHATELDGEQYTVTTGSPMIVFHKEILESGLPNESAPVLVSQNFFRHGDRYRYIDNETVDHFVEDEFLVQVVYGCQVTVTNPTSSRQKLEVLLQIPRGALPILNGKYTQSVNLSLEPYDTQAFEYHFYFPMEGAFPHYPVHVSKNGQLLVHVEPATMNVVLTPSVIDTDSWDYISQNRGADNAFAYLQANNLYRTNLDRIAWRMKDRDFFQKVTQLLRERHVYTNTLWAYSIMHNDTATLNTFLQHQDAFVNRCGAYIDTPILRIDPVIRKMYQHLEYAPLVNARAHQLGPKRRILNDRFKEQHQRFMRVLSYKPSIDAHDLMSVTHYLLTQDRIEDALAFFEKIERDALDTEIQYDYFDTYLAFYTEDIARARSITERYTDYPVDRWRTLFATAAKQLDEIEGSSNTPTDPDNRTQRQEHLAALESNFEFDVESRQVTIRYQNAAPCRIRYYVMDLELLFSRNPFVQEYSDRFLTVYPNLTEDVMLNADGMTFSHDLPESLRNSNLMVEVEIGGTRKSQAYYAHSLAVQVIENYGQLRVNHGETGEALPKVYVKVFARMQNGEIRFYKDGYTDLRGRFDYTSLNTNELDFVDTFSLLILSDTDGAVVREARPPKR